MNGVKEMQCKTALHYHNSNWLPYKYDINVYRGCSHSCVYCYARYSHDYIDGGSFFGEIYAKTNIADILRKELETFTPQPVNLGGVCDSYQHAEREYKLMPQVLDLRGRDAGSRLAQDAGFDEPPRGKDLSRFIRGGVGDKGAAVLLDIDQPFIGECLQGGARQRAADTEEIADIGF